MMTLAPTIASCGGFMRSRTLGLPAGPPCRAGAARVLPLLRRAPGTWSSPSSCRAAPCQICSNEGRLEYLRVSLFRVHRRPRLFFVGRFLQSCMKARNGRRIHVHPTLSAGVFPSDSLPHFSIQLGYPALVLHHAVHASTSNALRRSATIAGT
jgi:hypothetical protein